MGADHDQIWLVTNFKGLGIVALCERFEIGGVQAVRPDYLWYPTTINGERVRTTESEMDEKASFVVDRALNALLTHHLAEVDSPVQERINRGRMKARNNPLPELPKFIRITDESAVRSEPKGGHARLSAAAHAPWSLAHLPEERQDGLDQ